MQTIKKIAIVGAGYMAEEHAKAFATLPGVQIVGVCGRTRERTESFASRYSTKAFDTISDMYQQTVADLVIVAVNELSMREVCFESFKYPWMILLEKPVGLHLSEAEVITADAREKKRQVYVALNRRSYASTRRALAEMSNDDSPRLISVLDQQDMQSALDGGQPEIVVRNYMYANSIHLIDYFNVFGRGNIVSVQSILPWTPDKPGHVLAFLRYDSGDCGIYQAVWDGPGPWAVSVTNRQIRAEMRPLEQLGLQYRGERRAINIADDPIDIEYKPGLRHQAEQVLSGLSGQAVSLATLEDATRSMKLCADIYGLNSEE